MEPLRALPRGGSQSASEAVIATAINERFFRHEAF
jgi:hypothetical protein